ncbi:hypothetical protein BDF14DRAFT_1715815, partial [Spinellus fusiger]
MSCKSCGGCFTAKKSTTNTKSHTQHHRFLALLRLASKQEPGLGHDHVIPTITAELSLGLYSSQVALLSAYEQLSLEDFIDLARLCWEYGIQGSLVAWAWEYYKKDAAPWLACLQETGTAKPTKQQIELWDSLDSQAEMHEMFNGLGAGRVGRV